MRWGRACLPICVIAAEGVRWGCGVGPRAGVSDVETGLFPVRIVPFVGRVLGGSRNGEQRKLKITRAIQNLVVFLRRGRARDECKPQMCFEQSVFHVRIIENNAKIIRKI